MSLESRSPVPSSNKIKPLMLGVALPQGLLDRSPARLVDGEPVPSFKVEFGVRDPGRFVIDRETDERLAKQINVE